MKKLCAAVVLGALAGAGCGGAQRPAPPAFPASPAVRDDRAVREQVFALAAARERARERRLRAAIAAARRSPTVPGALRLARLTGSITSRAERRDRRDWAAAQATLGGLAGTRRAELGSVVDGVRALAAAHALSAGRIAPNFLVLRANTRFWPAAPLPAAQWRTPAGPAILQYYPGHGLQLQPLASWGRLNAIAAGCLRNPEGCPRRRLRLGIARLAGLGAQRSGFLAWEYYFAFAQGAPPWVSGMTQATAIQALARAYRVLDDPRWRRLALRGLGAFERPAPAGVAAGDHYALYSFAPGYRVLNGELQALIGLHDVATLAHSARAARLFRAAEPAARAEVAGFDTGAWSLYSERGAEATLGYHELMARFLGGLCDRTHAAVYCGTHANFVRYEREPTRIAVAPLGHPRVRRPAELRFTLSKVSSVRVRVWDAGGELLSRGEQLPRGAHELAWSPPRRGRYHVRIEAQGPSGPPGVAARSVRVGKQRRAADTRRRDVPATRRRPPAAVQIKP